MEDIYVAQLMSTDLVTATPETLVEDAARLLIDNDIGSLPTVDGDDLVGILTATDFVTIVAHSEPKAETTVERYMTTDLVTTTAQVSIRDAADHMVANDCHHLPVVDEPGRLIGMVSSADLAAYISHEAVPLPSCPRAQNVYASMTSSTCSSLTV
jgi:CBS domain-containing protein